jgi:hypothetical protein
MSAHTSQHVGQIAAILRDYPGAAATGFPQAIRDLRASLGCDPDEDMAAPSFRPDAYRINQEAEEIEVFEVEITNGISENKLLKLGKWWGDWDAEDEHAWWPVLITVDRYGHRVRRDLCHAYYELLTYSASLPASDLTRLNEAAEVAA